MSMYEEYKIDITKILGFAVIRHRKGGGVDSIASKTGKINVT